MIVDYINNSFALFDGTHYQPIEYDIFEKISYRISMLLINSLL